LRITAAGAPSHRFHQRIYNYNSTGAERVKHSVEIVPDGIISSDRVLDTFSGMPTLSSRRKDMSSIGKKKLMSPDEEFVTILKGSSKR
jgi:hypothetical protein